MINLLHIKHTHRCTFRLCVCVCMSVCVLSLCFCKFLASWLSCAQLAQLTYVSTTEACLQQIKWSMGRRVQGAMGQS